MTSTSVNSAGLDTNLFPVNTKAVNTQQSGKDQSFSTIMNQTVSKSQKSDTHDVKQEVKKDKAPSKAADTDNKTKEASVTEDVTKDTAQDVSQNTDNVPQDAPQETAPVDEEVKDVVNEVTDKLLNDISDELDISQEELVAVLEQLGLQPIDLLQEDNLAQLVATVGEVDSLIDVAADANLYQQLQNLTEDVNTSIEDILAQTGLSEEELMAALEQLKAAGEQEALQTPLPQDNVIPFAPDMEAAEEPKPQPVTQEEPVPVMRTSTEPQTTDTNVTEVSQMAEKTQKDESDQEEAPSYQEGQENFNKFQNPVEENAQVTEPEAVPTRTVDTESIMKQLADYVKIQQGSELTEMEMQLHPASLGNVHIQLAAKGGVVTAQITTQNETVKNAIESQVVQLKDNLEEQGVKVEAVEVSVASHEMEKNLDQQGRDQHSQEQENVTGNIHKIRRRNINLNLYNSEEEALEEAGGLDDAARIAMEMMAANGNTMDLLA